MASERNFHTVQDETAVRRRSARHMLVVAALSVLLLAGLIVVVPGTYVVDESAYILAARTFADHQSFFTDNTWSQYHSDNLRLWMLVDGQQGLTPQYPAGQAVLSAPFYALFGVRGLIAMNALAACATLFATYSVTIRFTQDRSAALVAVLLLFGATFWLDYTHAIWPHSLASMFTLFALLTTTAALEEARNPGHCVLAGAMVGLGMLFRLDTVLILPALGLILLLFSYRPVRSNCWMALGLAPFILFISITNFVKFGTPNPFSYGRTNGGGTSLSTHLPAMIALASAGLILLWLRLGNWRPSRKHVVGTLATACLLVLALDPLRTIAWRYLFGAYTLVADLRFFAGLREGIVAQPDGTVDFWGHAKKALGQSMPWLGLLAAAIWTPADADARFRRARLITLLVVVIWTLPFFIRPWEGGISSNLRYFLPLLPVLCAIAAKLLSDLLRVVPNSQRLLGVGALMGLTLLVLWTLKHPTGTAGAQQVLSTWIFLATMAMAVAAGANWQWQSITRAALIVLAAVGLVFSTWFLVLDVATTHAIRATNREKVLATASLPEKGLVYASGTYITDWAFRPGRQAALPISPYPTFDFALIDAVLAEGRPVLVSSALDTMPLAKHYGGRLVESGVPDGEGGWYIEVLPPEAGR